MLDDAEGKGGSSPVVLVQNSRLPRLLSASRHFSEALRCPALPKGFAQPLSPPAKGLETLGMKDAGDKGGGGKKKKRNLLRSVESP